MPNDANSPHRLMVEHATEGMVLLEHKSDTWRCRLANPAFGEAVGRPAAGLEGAEVADIAPRPLAKRIQQELAELDASDATRHWSYWPDDDSERRSWQIRLQPLAGGDARRILLVIREVTKQARRAARAESDRRALQRLYEVAGRTDLSFSNQLRELLQVGCARLNLPLGFITRLTDETQHIVAAVGEHPAIPPAELRPNRPHLPASDRPVDPQRNRAASTRQSADGDGAHRRVDRPLQPQVDPPANGDRNRPGQPL